MKKYLFFLPLLFALVFMLYKNQGFRPSKIFFPSSLVFTNHQKKIDEIQGKTFRYLSKGRQCFAFISEDNTLILKFLRFDKLQHPLWSTYLKKTLRKKNKRRSAWALCFSNVEKLPIDLGIIHSQLSSQEGFVILKDNLGRKHPISLKNTRFFLQKKVTPLSLALLQENHPEKIVQKFLISTAERLNKNIINKTQSCMENVGWLNNKIIEFDFGEITLQNPLPRKKENFLSFTKPMRIWLLKHKPDLVSYFDQVRDQTLQTL